MKTLIYDCEIIRCIPSAEYESGYEYCGGWTDHGNMGISVIGAWCNGFAGFEEGLHSFVNENDAIPGNFPTFQKLVDAAELIVGFNSINFDDKLCRANGIEITTTYDLLCEVRVASGQPRQYVKGQTRGGYSLGALAQANLGRGKSGSGELAPQLWQDGEREAVIKYCLDDVALTREIWEKRHELTDPTNGEILRLK